MAFKFSSDDAQDLADINVIPLVDVMLVLLIIFMVTAPLSIGGIQIALPTSKSKTIAIEENRIVLSVNRKGHYFLDKTEIPSKDLEAKLKAIYAPRSNKSLYIRGDRGVIYDSVVYAMSAARSSGVQKISMLTQSVQSRKAKL